MNVKIESDLPVYTKEVDQKKARKINTLRAVFGEKYPDQVRVVSIGADIDEMLADPKSEKWMQYSVEFCGGTHLKTSKDAERFVLITEEGVAKGTRRVVGISGEKACSAVAHGLALLELARSRLENLGDDLEKWLPEFQHNANEAVIPLRHRRELQNIIGELQQKIKQRKKQDASASGEAVMGAVAKLLKSAETINGVTVLVGEVPSAQADALRAAIDWVRNKTDASAVLLATESDNKVTLIAGMSKAVVARGVKAGDLIKEIAPIVGGRGGGRPDMAQGGGNDPTNISEALNRAKDWITEKLS